MQELIETEATALVGADRYECDDTRAAQRNGSRPRLVATQDGDVELRIPKLRQGSFFPVILERRRRIDQALFAGVMEDWVNGVFTRSVDDPVGALGIGSGISKSEVSRICAGLDGQVTAASSATVPSADSTTTFATISASSFALSRASGKSFESKISQTIRRELDGGPGVPIDVHGLEKVE